MNFSYSKLPEGCYLLRGFDNGKEVDNDDIDLVVLLTPDSDNSKVCWLEAAKGDMTTDGNIVLGLTVHSLGFHEIRFKVLKGKEAITRWATYTGSDDRYDLYSINLLDAVELYNASN